MGGNLTVATIAQGQGIVQGAGEQNGTAFWEKQTVVIVFCFLSCLSSLYSSIIPGKYFRFWRLGFAPRTLIFDESGN